MTSTQPARRTTRRTRSMVAAGMLVGIAAIAATLGYAPTGSPSSVVASAVRILRGEQDGGLGEADGAIPDGTTVFDDGVPGVANLNADLLRALRQAATDAKKDGIGFFVDSGWRSPEYQEGLL